ncbi:MAG: ATP-dependent zinc metalloprotease FtsH, partial [Bacteroidales bacterium]|nr:ATP-dependent zinc metalloprotease FtsH [Bacteroidales bacterium]
PVATELIYKYPFISAENFEKQLYETIYSSIQNDTIGKLPTEKQKIIESYQFPVTTKKVRNYWGDIFGWIITFALIILLWFFIARSLTKNAPGGGVFNVGKSKPKVVDGDKKIDVTFKDVAGLDEAKVEVQEIIEFLKNPSKYTKLGGKIPKGVLLIGPPGTGKTLLAKAVSGEAGVPFLSMSGSEFVEMFVGVGAARVRDLFEQAKAKAPCIIFIDEIDAIGRARGKTLITSANDERESTLNQLLAEMDGFSANVGIIVMAATNRADVLDKALLRAGRFDRTIYVDLPELKEREEIFKVHLRPLKLSNDVDIKILARQTPGFSGADIANVCNEAALIAARKNKNAVDMSDFNDAIDRIIGGLEKRNKIITPEEKKIIAFHESGHATVSWFLQYAHPLVKVSVVPRGKALGAAWYLPTERNIITKEQLLHEMASALGGRVSEQIFFGDVSSGAMNDLEIVTKQAYAAVTYYGFSEEIGTLSFYNSQPDEFFGYQKPYSEKTAEKIDEEAKKIINDAYKLAFDIISNHKDQLSQIAQQLLKKEVIFREDVEAILGQRPWPDPDSEIFIEPENNNNGQNANESDSNNHTNDNLNNNNEIQNT